MIMCYPSPRLAPRMYFALSFNESIITAAKLPINLCPATVGNLFKSTPGTRRGAYYRVRCLLSPDLCAFWETSFSIDHTTNTRASPYRFPFLSASLLSAVFFFFSDLAV